MAALSIPLLGISMPPVFIIILKLARPDNFIEILTSHNSQHRSKHNSDMDAFY